MNFFYLLILNTVLLLQGLILSNALRAQKNAEDEGCTIALNNLRSEVIELRNEGLEKDKILNSLVNKIKEDEATSKAQAEAQKCEIKDLQKQLAEAKLKCAIAEADRDASDYWKNYWEKTVIELRSSKERCYEKSVECVKKIKLALPTLAHIQVKTTSYGAIPKAQLNGSAARPKPLRRFCMTMGTSVPSLA
jgi:hypothetical protein